MFALEDVSVVTLESGISAPLATRYLGDFGADVVKVERPDVGDVHRHWDDVFEGHSSAHIWVDRNKESVELNLKPDEGREIFLELAERADVVVQNHSPGVLERLGIGYDDVRARNEDVVYVNISGYGREGPYRDRKAYDMVMQGETGLIRMNGVPEEPAKVPLSICDINAAMEAALGTLAALYHRSNGGDGQTVNVSMFGGMTDWLGYFPYQYWYADKIPERTGTRHHLITPYGPHETADDDYVNFAVLSEAHWETFTRDVIERPDLYEDPRFETNEKRIENREALESAIEAEIRTQPRDYWADRLEKHGIPWGDVNQIDDVLAHPQIEALDLVQEVETEDGTLMFADNPIDFGETDLRREPMPRLGEDSAAVLRRLGYSDAQIEELADAGVI
jgi:crotonobetainyl-CoA:carnitine CoA-transferase CaiB-like acyl-CoA transferase